MKDNAKTYETNAKEQKRLDGKVEKEGAFRAPTVSAMKARVYQPRYEGRVREVAKVRAGVVTDKDGEAFPSKLVLPVAQTSESVPDAMLTGDARKTDANRRVLRPFVQPLKDWLRRSSAPKYIKEIGAFLRKQEGWGEAIATARVGANLIIGFLRTFPEHFSVIQGGGGGSMMASVIGAGRVV